MPKRPLNNKSPQNPEQLLQQAFTWLQGSDLQGAALLFASLTAVPTLRLQALSGLGRAQRGLGQHELSIKTLQAALALSPQSIALRTELGMAERAAGRGKDAEQTYRQALILAPLDPTLNHNLGNLLQARGAIDEAVQCFSKVVEVQPNFGPAWLNLGFLLSDTNPTAATEALKRGLNLDASSPEALALLAKLLADSGQGADAEGCARLAVQLNGGYAYGHYALGLALRVLGRIDEAEIPLHRAAELSNDDELTCECLYLQTLCHMDKGLITAAMTHAEKLLSLCKEPNQFAQANQLLGALHFESGDIPSSMAHFQRSLDLTPDALPPRVTFCATSNYTPDYDPAAQLDLAQRLIGPLADKAQSSEHTNAKDPHRRLRVGYVSGDFRLHSCAFFLAPLFTHHNHDQFEVFGYSTSTVDDHITARLRSLIPHWRPVQHLSPTNLAQLIKHDQIDILVDLSGLTDAGRISTMALKPAPVQIGWLGYLGSTGLRAMDYRLTDHFVDGAGAEAMACEAPLRLPGHYVCYEPPADAPPPGPLPMHRMGHPTFGSFNALSKLSDPCVALWCQVLHAIPQAKLLLKTKALTDEVVRSQTLARFARHGVAAERLELRGWERSTNSHLEVYHQVDVALDTTPYNGVTTTCEAAWMGVPTVSMVGPTFASRQGLTLLTALGMADHAVSTADAFVAKCQALVADAAALDQLRQGLRKQMQQSPLTQGKAFTDQVEAAYRQVWKHWCA